MQKKMRHSKFRNTGILFELLTRQVTADIISGSDSSTARDLLYQYFKENTELGKEWQMYNALLHENVKDENRAERLLTVVMDSRKRLNNRVLSQEKFSLIKEIKEKYPIEEMLKSPVRNYKLLASIYKLFEDCVSNESRFAVKEVFQARNCIVEHISTKPRPSQSEDELITYYQAQTEEIRLLSYKLLVEKLNDRYSSILDDQQKSVLREYICNVANSNQFGDYVKQRVTEIKQSLSELTESIKDSDVIQIKIREVANQLDKINPGKIVKDNHVMVLMLSYELLKECRKQLGEQKHVI